MSIAFQLDCVTNLTINQSMLTLIPIHITFVQPSHLFWAPTPLSKCWQHPTIDTIHTFVWNTRFPFPYCNWKPFPFLTLFPGHTNMEIFDIQSSPLPDVHDPRFYMSWFCNRTSKKNNMKVLFILLLHSDRAK